MRALHLINIPVAPGGLFLPPLRERGFEIDDVDVESASVPASIAGYDAIVVCGGAANTHEAERYPWIDDEVELLREAIDRDIPVMGLCLGAQLLTVATGGEVYRSSTEIGWFDVEVDPAAAADPVLGSLPPTFTALEWHDYACTPASSTTTLARNDACVQAFRAAPSAWGTQFHIEVTDDLMLDWWAEGEEELRAAGYDHDRFNREAARYHARHQQIGRAMAERFASLAADRVAAQ